MLTTTAISALILVLLSMASTALASEVPALRSAVECTARGGLPNVFARLEKGQEVRIAYIGGSITAADGWRTQSLQWFQRQFPNARISEINAAVGGTGSDLGVFRLQSDVLEHKPDLLFVEFAVNDSEAAVDRIHKTFEGMVRQTWRANPNTDICFVYAVCERMLPDLQNGKFPLAVSAMEQVADHYAIPSVHVGMEVARLQQSGKLIFTAPLPATDAEKAATTGKIIFSFDGYHPYAQTGHPLYVQAVARAMKQIRPAGAPGPHPLVASMRADNWEYARTLPISSAKLSSGWQKLDLTMDPIAKAFQGRVPELWKASRPGETIAIRFKGTSLLIYDLLGPDCGQVSITLDGQRTDPRPRFDPWSDYHRLAMLPIAEGLPETVHTATIELLPSQPDKLKILHQRKENEALTELDAKKYNDTACYPAAILLIGELVNQP